MLKTLLFNIYHKKSENCIITTFGMEKYLFYF